MCQTLCWGFMNEQKQILPYTSLFTMRVRIKFKITPLMDLTGQRRWSQEGCGGSSEPARGVREGFQKEAMLECSQKPGNALTLLRTTSGKGLE